MGKIDIVAMAALALVACSGHADRQAECSRFADWSNGLGEEIERRVPTARLGPDATSEQRASWFRERAAAIRAVATQTPPFHDERVLGYATRLLGSYEPQAIALDAEAAGWAANDGAATRAAQQSEMGALAARQSIVDDWVAHCGD